MTLATWPSDVTLVFKAESYTERPERNVSSFPVDVGPALEARASSVATDLLSGTIPCQTSAEYESLMDFYRDDLVDGTLPFTRAHPRTSEASCIFKIEDIYLSQKTGDIHFVTVTMRRFR